MLKCVIWLNILIASNFLLGKVQGGRIRRQDDVDNTIIEVFNNCKCVSYYQCDENNMIITNGENLIDLRLGETSSKTQNTTRIQCKGGQFEGELICCRLTENDSLETRNPTNVDGPTSTPKLHECGVQRTKINVRILTDDDDEDDITPLDGEFPWITAIYKKNKQGKYIFHGSGALIHPKVILTANHYFNKRKAEDFKIVLTGNIELSTVGDDAENERNVEEIINHPDYYAGALYYDGALLILDQPFESSKTNAINSICLPPDNLKFDSGRCLVAGWGKGSTEGDTAILKKVDLPIVPFGRCQDLLRDTRLGKRFLLHDSFVCAGGEKNKDACKGDGGSPLMCLLPGETRYFHMGIVSWGIGCGEENVPGVYASTSKLKPWMLEQLKKRNIQL